MRTASLPTRASTRSAPLRAAAAPPAEGVFLPSDPVCLQPAGVEQTVRELTQGVLGADAPADLRTALHTLLNALQPDGYAWTPGRAMPDLHFAPGDGFSAAVLRRIMVVDTLPDGWALDAAEAADARQRMCAALDTLEAADAGLRRALNLVIGAVVFARRAHFGGGGNSGAVGCLWLNPKPAWTGGQWVEHLVHEYVHQALFLDDMRHGLFVDDGVALAQPQAQVTSALLETPRPYDRAFHSAFVSFTLMRLHTRLGQPGFVDRHGPALWLTTGQLADRSRWLTAHGRGLLDSLQASMAAWPQLRSVPCSAA